MNRHIAFAATGAALLVLTAWTPAANAASREFCRDYARAAVRQVRGALSHGRCIRHIDDDSARWSTDFQTHFRWCLDQSRDAAEAERDARRDKLERCAR